MRTRPSCPRGRSDAAGRRCRAVDAVLGQGSTRRLHARPPGHHATPSRARALSLQQRWGRGAPRPTYGIQRPVIDVDVHHGNGTEAFFRDDADYFTRPSPER